MLLRSLCLFDMKRCCMQMRDEMKSGLTLFNPHTTKHPRDRKGQELHPQTPTFYLAADCKQHLKDGINTPQKDRGI